MRVCTNLYVKSLKFPLEVDMEEDEAVEETVVVEEAKEEEVETRDHPQLPRR